LSGNLFAVRCAFVKNRFERFRTKGTKTCHFKHRISRKSLPLSRLSPPPPTGCSGLGLDCGSSSSDSIGLYDGNADTLMASLEIVQKTACQILDALTPANRPE
jgi:hypothetical protein